MLCKTLSRFHCDTYLNCSSQKVTVVRQSVYHTCTPESFTMNKSWAVRPQKYGGVKENTVVSEIKRV